MIAQSEVRQRGMQATKSLTPHVEIILSLRFGHKMIYMDIISLPRIHEEQLSAAGKKIRKCTKYWHTISLKLAYEQ